MSNKPSAKLNRSDLYNAGILALVGAGAGDVSTFLNDESHRKAKAFGQVPHPEKVTREVLEKAGVVFGDKIDDLFIEVKYPDGWKVVRTNHYMYSNLHDEKGRVRANIGLKAIDNWGYLRAERRLQAGYHNDNYMIREAPAVPVVKDSNGNILWRGTPIPYNHDKILEQIGENNKRRNKAQQELDAIAVRGKEFEAIGEDKLTPEQIKEVGKLAKRANKLRAIVGDYGGQEANSTDVARDIAQKVLDAAYPDNADLNAYWEVDTFDKLPANESEPPKGEQYDAYTEYYYTDSDGVADSGHAGESVFDTDEAAVKFFKERYAKERHYRIKVTVKCKGRVVVTFWAGAKRQQPKYVGFGDYYRCGEVIE